MTTKDEYELIQQSLQLLLTLQPNSLTKHEVIIIVKCLNKCDKTILQFADNEKQFFAPFVALSGHCIITNASQIPKSLLSLTSSACTVVLQYILHQIAEFDDNSLLTKKQLIGLIQGLCDDIPPLLKADIVELTATLKATSLPDTLNYRPTESTAPDLKTLSIASLRDDSTPKEAKRLRLDHSCEAIIEQLMTPIMETTPKRDSHLDNDKNIISPVGIASQSHDTKGLLIGKNLFNLQQLGGTNVLLDFIMSLSTIKPFIQLVHATEEGAPLKLPTSGSDIHILNTCKLISKDYEIIWRILLLPILEPLTEERLSKVITIIHACLYVSLTLTASTTLASIAATSKGATAAPSKDDENDTIITEIVDTSLQIYKRILMVMKSSIRVGGQICQNVHMFASWLLLSGIKMIMKSSPTGSGGTSGSNTTTITTTTATSSSSGVGGITGMPTKEQTKKPGYNTLCISLASHAVQLLSSLFDDLKSEISLGSYNRLSNAEKLTSHHSSTSFKYNKFGYYSAWQRIEMLMSNINITNLLFSLASASYRKAGLMRSISRLDSLEKNEKNISPSVTSVHDLDDESCFSSDDSSRDEDSEPILGHLFKEQDDSQSSDKSLKGRQTLNIGYCSDKHEPQRHLTLSTSIFELLNTYFVCSEIESLRQYFKQTINEPQICILAHIIKDLDRESAHNFSFYSEFSMAMTSFMHNLIATEILSDNHKISLLVSLGVFPDPASDGLWPLYVAPKTLAVLSQIVLLNHQKEKEDLRFDTNSPSIQIWRGLLNRLTRMIIGEETRDYETEDINVEHSQLLLFLFHNIKLLQRKQVLLLVAQAIVDTADTANNLMTDYQIHCLGRLTHFFEYMIKNLYDAPTSLIEQIDNNLFKSSTAFANHRRDKDNNIDDNSKLYFHCHEIDDNYQKFTENKLFATTMRPRFYYLLNIDNINYKEVPKLDGMALNFLLVGIEDIVPYNTLYESLITLLNVGAQYDLKNRHLSSSDRLNNLGLCAIQYTFNSVWRILLQLPPSVRCLTELSVGDVRQFDNSKTIHYSIWISRIVNNKWFYNWIKESKLMQNDTNIKPEALLKSVANNANSISFNVELLKRLMLKQFSLSKSSNNSDELITVEEMPLLLDMFTLDVLCAKTHILLDSCYNLSDNSSSMNSNVTAGTSLEAKQSAIELLPLVLNLVSSHLSCARSSLIHQMVAEDELQGIKTITKLLNAYNSILKITSSKCNSKLIQLTLQLATYLPKNLMKILVKWNLIPVDVQHWRNEHNSSSSPSESYIMAIQSQHFNAFSVSLATSFNSNTNLKHFVNTLLKLAEDLYQWSDNKYSEDFIRVMLSLQLDSTCESYSSYGLNQLDSAFGSKESDNFVSALYMEALTHSYDLLINYSNKDCCVDEKILIECIKFMESLLDTIAGQSALEKFFCEDDTKDIVQLLMSASNDSLSSAYSTRVLKFFSKLFQHTEKNPDTISLVRLCTSLSKLSCLGKPNNQILQTWLSKVLCERTEGDASVLVANQENRILLQNLTSYIVKDTSAVDEEVATVFLSALIPMGSQILSSTSEVLGFSELMQIMTTLAGAGTGAGHLELIKAVIGWLDTCKRYLSQKDVIEKLQNNINTGRHQMIMESTCHMLSYLADIYEALEFLNDSTAGGGGRATSPDGDTMGVMDDDWIDECPCPDDDESLAEDSDEESLCNKLCTFTTTQKEFMNQHWYHCHTCKMIEGVGVCTICAKVCHKDHDVTYAKNGSFFCDCGAKEDGSCIALTRRAPNVDNTYSTRDNADPVLPSSLRRSSSPSMDKNANQSTDKSKESMSRLKHESLVKQLENSKPEILSIMSTMNLSWTVLNLLKYLSPSMMKSFLKNSSIGSSIRAKEALKELHIYDKSIESSDQLMVPTLGSQEGAFENVRMTFTGEQGQQIRQLMQQQVIRRVAMCALASNHGKRQHLAVSHEKGKITLLQLATLLKQADSSTKKLTLTRLASAPLPFTAISIAGNPCNEDYLAVCGLKDCHVLTFSQLGVVSGHLVLHPQLESSNYVIKAVWLPGSQTELALVTADFVKIFNLGQDILSPQYFFLLPSGKIRDITFVVSEDGQRHVLIMSSAGHIYCQIMSEESSAQNGQFYVTSILDIRHDEIIDSNGNINGGGVSLYYSHTFQLLFFSYSQGKNYCTALPNVNQEITNLFPIEILSTSNGSASSNGSSSKSTSSPLQSLCQWTEVGGHPGLILAMSLSSNNPIILMVKPNTIIVQEIKPNSKSKITDMVAMRHSTQNGDMRTTLILLCEDGSLRIYMASQEATNYWLRPALHSSLKPYASNASKARRTKKSVKVLRNNSTTGSPQFSTDFFEHCNQISDIDFGGSDVLQIYNTHQVKNRLNTNGMYIASTKPNGFSIEVYNNDATSVMVGVRVMVAFQDVLRAPTAIEIFGRSIPIAPTRSRWYDLPFTREESLTADKKITITLIASNDPNGVTIVDSIKVYGKTKEAFGWPEDNDEYQQIGSSAAAASAPPPATSSSAISVIEYNSQHLTQHFSSLERLLSYSLDVLDGCFHLSTIATDPKERQIQRDCALEIATQFLTLPYNESVESNVKSLLATLHSTRAAYNSHRDQAIVNYVIRNIDNSVKNNELDGESFFRWISMIKQIAIERPHNLIKYNESAINLDDNNSDVGGANSIEMTTFGQNSSHMSSSQSSSDYYDNNNEEQMIASRLDTNANERVLFCQYLSDIFWKLYSLRPNNPLTATIARGGLVHIEETVQALVEIIHSFALADVDNNIEIAGKLYLKLLLCEDTIVSFCAKQSLIRVLRPRTRKRRVYIPSPPHCETPHEHQKGGSTSSQSERQLPTISSHNSLEVFVHENPIDRNDSIDQHFEVIEALDVGDPHDNDGQHDLIGGANPAFPHMFNPDVDPDDEAMVELAIALSLQDQQQDVPPVAAPNVAVRRSGAQRSVSLEDRGHYSDTTASAAASDDEGSTAATDGSTLRTSPANEILQGNEAGSESGGSVVESIIGEHNVSGRSSAYGEELGPPPVRAQPMISFDSSLETDIANNQRLHNLRIALLEKMIESLPEIRDVGGLRSIPFMQVILMLTSDLDGEGDADKLVLNSLLAALLTQLSENSDMSSMIQRNPTNEVKLIIMRLLSILMSRVRTGSSSSKMPSSSMDLLETSSAFCSSVTATTLMQSNILDFCLQILIHLLSYWKTYSNEESSAAAGTVPSISTPLKTQLLTPPPEMSPFFMRPYVRGHADDVFESYPHLLTEMITRMPYQIKKIANSLPNSGCSSSVQFAQCWTDYLCQYMMINLTPYIRKQVRKLLSFICGSKERYRQIRDLHSLEHHMNDIKKLCRNGGFVEHSLQNGLINLSYDALISLIEHLKSCSEIATNRTINWQKSCQKDPTLLPFLIQVSFLLDEGVSSIVLHLLQCALCAKSSATPSASAGSLHDDEPDEPIPTHLVQQMLKYVDNNLLSQFIQCFLLESNSSSHRWAAHSLIYNMYKSFSAQQQETLLDILWTLWPKLPSYGKKAAQFVDLLGYFTLKVNYSDEKEREFTEKALTVLRQQNQHIYRHPNSNLYNSLQSLVEFDGYYLESEPCLVCNNPEVNYLNMKLSSIKVDSRFTTTTQIVKLIGSHTISKITLRISDIKRSKMVKTLNIFYNNRAVQSVVELKNKTALWHKARRYQLTGGQTELKIEFPLPIVACNLMIEYSDFYDNIQATNETLQCPRCSATVAANPGVCSNCGENVFQCHKCRAINYDEKDPFLCNSCGFCKYAKFDYTLTAKPTCAVDPIENEDDRKKTVQSINSLLEKADRVYKNLIANKPSLELLLLRIQEHGMIDKYDADAILMMTPAVSSAPAAATSIHVNRAIQQVAIKYCQDCKSSFDELSKIIQRVLASRKELVDYDNKQKDKSLTPSTTPRLNTRRDSKVLVSMSSSSGRCFGCASATVEHCITLLKALAISPKYRTLLCSYGLLRELVDYNLRIGTNNVRHEVRQLLCSLTRDNYRATADLNNLLMDKISVAIKSRSGASIDLSSAVRHEIALLSCSMEKEDSCWELRLRCVMQLFLMGLQMDSPAVLDSITLPCLRLLQSLIKPEPTISKKNKDKTIEQLATVKTSGFRINVDLNRWLAGDPNHSFKSWRQRSAKRSPVPQQPIGEHNKSRAEIRAQYLSEKYGLRWKDRALKTDKLSATLMKASWLRTILFNGASRSVRLMACSLIEALFQIPSRKKEIIDLLTSYLDDLGQAGEFGNEFFSFYHSIIQTEHWKYYLSLNGLLQHLGVLITKEIDNLNRLEEITLNSDLSQGCSLKMLVELLQSLIDVPTIRRQYKSRLVAFVLNGYLSLRKLVVQRTKVIDETQESLLELLEEMTTGTESETAAFMSVCVDAVNKCQLYDMITPVFIFERLCSIIYPEENDSIEFFMTLEKDPQQDDFLQGRMLGNPYSSNDTGMGPLMRDIKNKICQDCELVALLEDDSGLELLVNNKIISLDLPVKEVYRKIWQTDNNIDSDAMKIVYRIRGLMGDATEEFIETLDSKDNKEVNEEELYKMANIMAQCNGLQVMLQRLRVIEDLSSRSRLLMQVLLKLFGHCIRVKNNRQALIDPQLNTIDIMLNLLKLILTSESAELISQPSGPGLPSPMEQLMHIMQTILVEASQLPEQQFDRFCDTTCGTCDDIKLLAQYASSNLIKGNVPLMTQLTRLIPFLTLGNAQKMSTLLAHFKPYLVFEKFDFDHTLDTDHQLELFCMMSTGIENNANGARLKQLIIEDGIVASALEYLLLHAPTLKTSLLGTSEEWKEFTSRPALKYVLRILTGLSHGHESTQLLVSKESIPIIHGLEQVASDAHIGSLAEYLMEAIKENSEVKAKIEEVRLKTRDEKKRLAMAVREKELGALGMRTNDKGQVTAKASLLKQVEDLGEEAGLICSICREGYKFQPNKVLGIYTYTKRCNLDDFEIKQRKSLGYTTVTHFNVVHVDCHMAAVRHARGRDEWESAALQNANTRCNGLLPLWGPQVQESAFASALARHNNYLQECTGHREVSSTSYSLTIQDLKLLIRRFAFEMSFSDDTGGGGSQSNLHMIPYMIHMALYVINTTRSAIRETKKINSFLEMPANKWIENCYESESPFYWCTMSIVIFAPKVWHKNRLKYLQRLILCAHVRHVSPHGSTILTDSTVQEFSVYKNTLIFFAFVDALYTTMFKSVKGGDEWGLDWPLALAEYIRNNDQSLLESGNKMLRYYEEDLLPSQSFAEFCDVCGLLSDIPDANEFIENALKIQ
ncbi:E3 ubiquitin-protein ligase UBR4-like [Oppia nitens]|uniref:E3 ubiquitin-protein ligase UBR4-like n=1 Tax=Oppia nitens TaxID=1686743 RepID=UPI0023DAAE4F|nr:E3 ubiquitin-protein ligase UBR4-like [Oppia nitens]